ncbi:MAG: 2-amino-4-hydroxy-6-hydroxymethyldihydropteridine diphosphokinase [Actinobacteria bacterium]|nr:2-amino-4-hydroxy-6-hydroxymethyldihydropteridine diphosphokinase [Actinomycetota bacterium]NBP42977.1 2-amino-4-hydroxy-6-hydroxymethyldihydropteridine diphosphokinase [Actinomycetota bacterium]NBQ00589.1 2-amino-4-hydroxy-6-hydroxymethyldihydropteridine diphosphokinase [Actinomycetota bacterium]NBY50242.1 2-amino-4-hydroxy-6-hydroxymethyldihydropteridine diphosphokinase [Actinomycetota bacterium]NCU82294.1 2-amino-4-hydroxy-6-hydroxymethyldihydropteridine diphosphokinase [Actinomycetota ba
MRVVIALGANLGNPRAQLDRAIEALGEVIKIDAISSFYETKPFRVNEEQPNYLNAVLIAETDLTAEQLMKQLLAIEERLGRKRSTLNAARTIDIDIIDYQGMVITSQNLILPHPRAYEREFVLRPWLEIDSEAHLVGFGAVKELLAALN